VIAGDAKLAAVQRIDATDAQRVRGDALDLRAEEVQERAEVLNVP
jgi:hypothetical protein